MTKTIIKVENLSKLYRLGVRGKSAETITGLLINIFKSPLDNFRRIKSLSNFSADDPSVFRALSDVSFEIKQGEIVAIIGANGAGKSTLLKILSRITEPTAGSIRIDGRISSLLEVGTGFHPEMTGRENIYMNGTILGMTKREIDDKLDEIISFSGIEQHIDTPVKFYSSGMKVRLGFSVAAHLEPEILIIDEVLAVGDSAFQRKCLGKMDEIANGGRTILFVSHNMQAVRALCTSGILLDKGKLVLQGDLNNVVKEYDKRLRSIDFSDQLGVGNEINRRGKGHARFNLIAITNNAGENVDFVEYRQSINFDFRINVNAQLNKLFVVIMLRSGISREPVCSSKKILVSDTLLKRGDSISFKATISNASLRPGEYPIYCWLGDEHFDPLDVVDDLTAPLVVVAKGDPIELGFDPAVHSGYFDLELTLKHK